MGGNDSNNLIVPLASQTYGNYASGRGELAAPMSTLSPLLSTRLASRFGMPPETQALAALYRLQALAFVANVGDVLRPINKQQYFVNPAGAAPPDVSSHTATSKMQFLLGGWATPQWWSALLRQTPDEFEAQAFKFADGMTAASTSGSWITGPRLNNPSLSSALDSIVVRTPFPQTGIGLQLLRAVKLAQAGANLGLGNQIINCQMGGWDTHANQASQNTQLYTELSQALYAFYHATIELRLSQTVTAFTWSEFNRSLAPNQTHGTAHGWGGNQIVIGGAVAGGDVYGALPSFQLGGPDDAGGNGSWIPSTSTAQFAATLANWFGLSAAEQRSAFPGLVNFPTVNLGFFRA